jgi:predicted nucleic acid-binding protein
MCRFAQLGLMRLLGNRTVMGGQALSGAAAWQLIEELMEDERVEFVEEPRDLDGIFGGQLRYPVPTVKLTGDAYMAAFAMALERKMVTFDRGFRQFAGLDVEVLGEV